MTTSALEYLESDPQTRADVRHALVLQGIRRELLARRKSLGLTQAAVARSIGISQAAVSQLERADSVVNWDRLTMYATAVKAVILGYVVDEALVDGMTEPPETLIRSRA